MNKKVILFILDGWGISPDPNVSAIDQAKTPFMDSLYQNYPHATLRTDGLQVGLPEGQMGNSEVGHMNLGAGRIVYQDLVKINIAIQDKKFHEEKAIQSALTYAKENNKNVHFIGLVSDGGVHSHYKHLEALVEAADAQGLTSYVHAFTDGRDVAPTSGIKFIEEVNNHLEKHNSKLASVIGRYYAMDRDKRWERVKLAYDLLVHGTGEKTTNILEAIQKSYDNDVTDEFIKPIVLTDENGNPVKTIEEGDAVIFFNFRTDRGRELTETLTQQAFPEYDMQPLDLHFTTMTNYNDAFNNIHVIYPKDNLTQTIGEVLEANKKKQIRIAETEKYPHVTFFFSGGREVEFDGEQRIMCPSPKVATYDLQPEMSAYDLTNAIIPEIEKEEVDFVCLNYANTDMVGHTGVMEAAVKAAETVDSCLEKVVKKALEHNYTSIVIADHGNSETMMKADGSPHTAHTTNPVPVILVDKELKNIKDGILANIAPTILDLMGVEKPEVMDQDSLVS
ncbi:2,3-bisphosphoglycerate-independent phosphoglycerate mutase [Aureivirga sp. CE67]|uniref:2,3-bisphosphoglycerate-independent phosphoglycerate mutase n=1 Tax=Aureivirga sp. CE67 TaxID=1788983 RepID=UPI0018CA1F6D|nr:2,3-bisphosphoglycerate-independent phosphoglycerate mutase [Aureivirga sp. CE67]